MYYQHFGFDKAPFKIPPDPEFFFPGGNRGAVLEALIYAVSRGEGIVKVVGEVGSGKTMLCRMLERDLPENCEIVYLANPRLTPDQILHAIAFELEIEVADSANRLEVTHALQDYLIDKHANKRRVVVFIEEAQAMPLETLEEIRMLSNLETTQDKLLQIVLFGQPELNDKLERHEIRQLKERITYRFELPPFKPAEIQDYVNTRTRASGYRGADLFSSRAVKVLWRQSKGLLRRINILADKALLAAFSRNDRTVGPRHVKMAAQDSEFTVERRSAPLLAAGAAGVVGLGLIGFWLWSGEPASDAAPRQQAVQPAAPTEPDAAQSPVPEQSPEPEVAAPRAEAPGEVLGAHIEYADSEAISKTIADNSSVIEDVSDPSDVPPLPEGILSRDLLRPDLRPYFRLETLRQQLLDE
jgi:type II secretory pathway predicted ATPase ExeA